METRYLGTVTAVRKGEVNASPYRARSSKHGYSVALFLLIAVICMAISGAAIQVSAIAERPLSPSKIEDSLRQSQSFSQITKQPGQTDSLPITKVTRQVEEARISLEVPMDDVSNTGFKAYMDYRALTNRASTQYSLQQDAYTNEAGFRMYDGYYMVALGTFYAQSAGEKFHIVLDSGVEFDVITGDIKSDAHTDSKHQHRNGNIVEFIVDTKLISRECRVRGDMSYAGFEGKILEIQLI